MWVSCPKHAFIKGQNQDLHPGCLSLCLALHHLQPVAGGLGSHTFLSLSGKLRLDTAPLFLVQWQKGLAAFSSPDVTCHPLEGKGAALLAWERASIPWLFQVT